MSPRFFCSEAQTLSAVLFACPWKDHLNVFAAADEGDAAEAEVVGWVVAGTEEAAGMAACVEDAGVVLGGVDVAGVAVAQLLRIRAAVARITKKMSVPFFISLPSCLNQYFDG
jgi:hypothetical protein